MIVFIVDTHFVKMLPSAHVQPCRLTDEMQEGNQKDPIRSYFAKCAQQQSDYEWLTHPFDHAIDLDQYHHLVVRSSFPTPLNESDLNVYNDTAFIEFSAYLRERIKALHYQCLQNLMSEDFILADHTDGAVSATLLQSLSRRTDDGEVEMVVGLVSLTRRPPAGYRFDRLYWDQQEARTKTALRYIFGREAPKSVC